MVPLGTPMPEFTLPDASGQTHTAQQVCGDRGTLVIFMCNHCPFVVHIADMLGSLASRYMPQGIGVVGINSNDIEAYPQDGPEAMIEFARTHDLKFPYLLDASQEVARAFDAACTPDFFLYAQSRRLVYRGQLDDARPGSDAPVSGRDLIAAMDAVLEGTPVPHEQVPSLGCNIKWKAAD